MNFFAFRPKGFAGPFGKKAITTVTNLIISIWFAISCKVVVVDVNDWRQVINNIVRIFNLLV